jgi:HEAT repeats
VRSWKEKIKAFFLFRPFFSKRLERENNYLQLIDDKPTKLIELLKINHTKPKKELSWWILLRDEMDESDRSVAVPKLMELLNTSNGELRREAFDALRLIGKSALPALPLLLRFLHHPDPEVRSSSACTLGGLSNPVFDKEWGSIGEAAIVAIPHLLHLLDDPIADVRAKALGALKLIASVPCLLEPVFDAAPNPDFSQHFSKPYKN